MTSPDAGLRTSTHSPPEAETHSPSMNIWYSVIVWTAMPGSFPRALPADDTRPH
jgi:hypothetical protein